MTDTVDTESGEVTSGEVVYYNAPQAPGNLFGTEDPAQVVVKATATAKALADVIKQRQLYVEISGKAHVQVEAWTMLGSMLGVFPVVVWTRKLDEGGWEARAEARTLAGAIVGAAEAMCTRDEKTWGNRPEYALRAMAQTRAVSRAMRAPLGFIVQLAGYNPTPAEEMPAEAPQSAPTAKLATKAQHAKLNAALSEADAQGVDVPDYLGAKFDSWLDYCRAVSINLFGVKSRKELTTTQMSELIDEMEKAAVPFG